MAEIRTVVDDIDGSPNAETITFTLKGVNYRLDLSQKNMEKFEKQWVPWVEKATVLVDAPRSLGGVSPGVRAIRARNGAAKPTDTAQQAEDRAARQWAIATGYQLAGGRPVGIKGRLHPDVRAAWVEAGKPDAPQ